MKATYSEKKKKKIMQWSLGYLWADNKEVMKLWKETTFDNLKRKYPPHQVWSEHHGIETGYI